MSSTPTAPRTKLEQNQTNISYLIFPGVPPHLLWRYRGPVAFVVSAKVNLIAADHNKFKTTSSDIFEKIKTVPRAILLTSVSHLTLVLNSSTNILIYCWKVLLNAPKYF